MRRKSRPLSSRNAQLGRNGLTIFQILEIFYESASFFNQKNVSLFYLILAICQSKYRENSHKYDSANKKKRRNIKAFYSHEYVCIDMQILSQDIFLHYNLKN